MEHNIVSKPKLLYNITFRPDPEKKEITTRISYEAVSQEAALEIFFNDHPEQKEAAYREIHEPLENYRIREDIKQFEANQKLQEQYVDVSDIQLSGEKKVGSKYYVYERSYKSFGYTKYASLFAPHESNTGGNYMYTITLDSDGRWRRI